MNSQSKKMELLGSTSIPKALLSTGIPTMIGMLVNAFYNHALQTGGQYQQNKLDEYTSLHRGIRMNSQASHIQIIFEVIKPFFNHILLPI